MHQKIFRGIVNNRYAFLLVALVITLGLVPLFREGSRLVAISHLSALTLVFIAGVHANRESRRAYLFGIWATVLAVPVMWSSLANAECHVSVLGWLVVAGFCLTMAVLILISVFRDVTKANEGILGAISAYLLIGLGWACLYGAAVHISPGAIQLNLSEPATPLTAETPFADLVYFSFVTMSTLGFGDFSPISPYVRSIAWLQSVVGQFYLAVLVARLISIMPRKVVPAEESSSDDE